MASGMTPRAATSFSMASDEHRIALVSYLDKGLRYSIKTAVAPLVRREGGICTRVVGRVNKANLCQFVDEMTDAKDSHLRTDGLPAYKSIGKSFKSHESVDHTSGEYARGDAHCNTAESLFALLKRGVHGTFHHVSKGHLHRYCDEFAFRWNHRKTTDGERTEAAIRLAPNCRLAYESPKLSAI